MNAVDMSDFIAAKSDQLNADDLMDSPRTVTITKVTAAPDSADQPVSVHYEGGEGRPFKPCKTCRRIMVAVWGKDASKYVGRSMTLYRDPDVQFGGMKVGGIRISAMSHMDGDKTVALLVTRGRKAPFKVKALAMQQQRSAQPVATGDDAATRWANGYIAKLADFTTIAALQIFAEQKAVKLAELADARPDLHDKVTTALATRSAELKPSTTFDDDDFGTSAEGNASASVATAPSSEEAASTDNGETTSNNGQTATTAASPSEDEAEHPGKALADTIIAEINLPETNAAMDVARILTRHEIDLQSMLDGDQIRVEIAADRRKNAIRAEQEAAKAKEVAE